MHNPDYEISAPERYIFPSDLPLSISEGVAKTFFYYDIFLHRSLRKSFTPGQFYQIQPVYSPRLPEANINFHPVFPAIEIPYKVGAAILTGDIPDNSVTPENSKRNEITAAITKLLQILDFSSADKIFWKPPHIFQGGRGTSARIDHYWKQQARFATYNPKEGEFSVDWHQFYSEFIPQQEFRPHSLVASLKYKLKRVDYSSALMMACFDVLEVGWEEGEDGKPRLEIGKNTHIVNDYLFPRNPQITLLQGDYRQCQQLQQMVMSAFGLGNLVEAVLPGP